MEYFSLLNLATLPHRKWTPVTHRVTCCFAEVASLLLCIVSPFSSRGFLGHPPPSGSLESRAWEGDAYTAFSGGDALRRKGKYTGKQDRAGKGWSKVWYAEESLFSLILGAFQRVWHTQGYHTLSCKGLTFATSPPPSSVFTCGLWFTQIDARIWADSTNIYNTSQTACPHVFVSGLISGQSDPKTLLEPLMFPNSSGIIISLRTKFWNSLEGWNCNLFAILHIINGQ